MERSTILEASSCRLAELAAAPSRNVGTTIPTKIRSKDIRGPWRFFIMMLRYEHRDTQRGGQSTFSCSGRRDIPVGQWLITPGWGGRKRGDDRRRSSQARESLGGGVERSRSGTDPDALSRWSRINVAGGCATVGQARREGQRESGFACLLPARARGISRTAF